MSQTMSQVASLDVGIGCRRHVSAEQIAAAVGQALGAVSFEAIRCIATIESKADEPGLREFCARHGLPLLAFSREEIAALSVPLPMPSAAARKHLGIDGVCEPCALLAAPHGRLIVRKMVLDGVTVAVAANAADARDAGSTPQTLEPSQQDLP
ncbi:cobalamin biosynthesis protein [Paraburkholderia sp. BCC1885]|uniref:cobalamin biosynthesis protein n=1 Tax=Paraburkholderia sp. BCC1885 TaxID=2562669 RepID=UPI00391F9738